ncbi:putative toxin-antitoxin system toxin component, PIN family [Candidatus Shapirobacteria bacterium CG03_land_8_20_14_0_80_40_19]|uniref:Putative toxin-antitoxin system toxin component, PIN family n=4 Tax=Candidatus Shapironibacteriota TaxID=1752721 RepID=A0A2M7BFN7_9BACT|nr:MAG: putative toxin-antitoxin system toxin component, PIN family [Candidatus Shapirobacteria bacterium CG11_big_fil_rev_8_21_14_0_20_40_12]PIV01941.1 MAG: putative toxin-antitoxin system toxin component, PIN family [Candidatus Shapirobacteria bacterium CG03_land_8_20_14_0_80_40_19]PJC28833.1 MAG: putative toxin-antitoxin system toxin component, PIN family [Candidatus Shapirobacteria bacterium CG_4_9_14_0_2_um_filter_40_11]PJC77688.1 MAG: putative toxin-antitoxin system toxin component, PIN fa
MIKAVVDTNILVSGLISPKASPAKIISLWRERKFVLVVSEKILEEVKRVLFYPKIFKKYSLDKNLIDKYIKIFRAFAEVVEPKEKIRLIKTDESDNRFIEAAISANAGYLVSGDKHLLEIKKFQSIRIIKAEEFAKLI